jgi:hypothetical protein
MDKRQLLSDLETIGGECRRKFASVKQLTDAALDLLSSEANDYSRSNVFPPDSSAETADHRTALMTVIQPFLLALDTGIVRCVQISLSCLQRFISVNLFPAVKVDWLVMRLGEMMTGHQQSLQRQIPQIQEHQLKSLQLLLQLNMNYRLSMDSFSESLFICFHFFTNVPAASLAAKATILQIMHRSLDQAVSAHSKANQSISPSVEDEVILKRYESVVTGVAVDEMKAYLMVHDICKLLDKHSPVFLRLERLENDAFGMELLSSALDHSPILFRSHLSFRGLLNEINVLLVRRSVLQDRSFPWMIRFLRLQKSIISYFIDINVSSHSII